MTSESGQTIESLLELIERLRDPIGSSHLYLGHEELDLISAYEGVDDFSEFLDAVKANTTVTKVDIYGFTQDKKGAIFPIINPLLKHLPNLNEVTFHVFSDSPAERFLFNNTASLTTVFISHDQPSDDKPFLELHPTLDAIEYCNAEFECANTVIGPALLSLPCPPTIRELVFAAKPNCDVVAWNDEMARPFTSPELNRLVEMIQLSSLLKLTLEDVRFSSLEECSQFGQGLEASPVEDLCLRFYTPDADNYRAIVSALSKMPHLESLEATFALDDWHEDAETVGSFSIPVGSIVQGAPGMKTLKIGQGWKNWDDEQCRDLAVAIQAPSCGLKVLWMDCCQTEITMAGAAAIMSTFSAPSSLIEEFSCKIAPFEVKDVDYWLFMLPETSMLRRLVIDGGSITKVQEEQFLDIVSGWYYLTGMSTSHEERCLYDCLGEDCREQLLTLFHLNNAGRHYLTSPTPSKADGVEVLVKVRHRVNDVYTHLLENPCLCDRGVET